jgi:hypothetical protein
MKQRKIAISLAVVGAIAAPFVFQTYNKGYWPQTWKPLGYWRETWQPLTAEERQRYTENINRPCSPDEYLCPLFKSFMQKDIDNGGVYVWERTLAPYLLSNAIAVVATFIIIFGLTYLLPAITRRYWRWLKT